MDRNSKRPIVLSAPGAPLLLGSSILARLPLAMFGISLLVHAQRLTGSFVIGGAVTGAYAIASAISAPPLGRLVDRHGQTWVLAISAAATALVLVANAMLRSSAPPLLFVALGAGTGLATPPLAACVRTLLPALVADPVELPALFAFESTALELTFILGPPLALGVAAAWSSGAPLLLGAALVFAGTLLYAAQPASRSWRPDRDARPRGGSLRSPAIRTLVVILLATGAVFGATDVGVLAAARALGRVTAAGPLLGLWGIGSLLGGMAAMRRGGSAWAARKLSWLLAALALFHGALILTTGSLIAIAAVILLAGATIAPTVAGIYALVGAAAPTGTRTEAFSWLVTASLTGSAAGSAGAGLLVQAAGAQAAFALVAAAGALAAGVAVLRSHRLAAAPREPGGQEPRGQLPERAGECRSATGATDPRRRAIAYPGRPARPARQKLIGKLTPMAVSRPSTDLPQQINQQRSHT
jgi:MFS family permease